MADLSQQQARNIARVLYAVRQRRAARLATQQGQPPVGGSKGQTEAGGRNVA